MDINFNLLCNSDLKNLIMPLHVCVRVCFCMAARRTRHCFVCAPICCCVGRRRVFLFFFPEMSLISAPIYAETLSDDRTTLLSSGSSFFFPPTHFLSPSLPLISVSAQDEIAPRRVSTIPSDSQSADCSPRLPPHYCGRNAAAPPGVPSAWFCRLRATAGNY